MARTTLTFLAAILLSGVASAQPEPDSARELPVVPADADLVLALDCRAIYNDPTFDAIMDLVEASDGFVRNASPLEAWGFDARADVHGIVFVVGDLGASDGEFVIIAAGELSADEVNGQLSERGELSRTEDDRGGYWEDANGLHFLVTPRIAIAGTGEMFTHARNATLGGSTQAWRGSDQAIQLNVHIDEELREAHPALGSYLVDLVVSVELGREPTFHLRAETPNPSAASSAVAEVVQVLQAVLDIPEVTAMGFDGLLQNADVSTDGSVVNVSAVLDAESWRQFSATLSELIAEELR